MQHMEVDDGSNGLRMCVVKMGEACPWVRGREGGSGVVDRQRDDSLTRWRDRSGCLMTSTNNSIDCTPTTTATTTTITSCSWIRGNGHSSSSNISSRSRVTSRDVTCTRSSRESNTTSSNTSRNSSSSGNSSSSSRRGVVLVYRTLSLFFILFLSPFAYDILSYPKSPTRMTRDDNHLSIISYTHTPLTHLYRLSKLKLTQRPSRLYYMMNSVTSMVDDIWMKGQGRGRSVLSALNIVWNDHNDGGGEEDAVKVATVEIGRRATSGLVILATAQLRVHEPPELFEGLRRTGAFTDSNENTLLGATAEFGTPGYGTVLLGRAYFVSDSGNHCEDNYCETIKNQISDFRSYYKPPRQDSGHTDNRAIAPFMNSIVFVDRGSCTFVHKVRIAQNSCGAQAVVVMDRFDSKRTRLQTQHVVMSFLGSASDVDIPSMLITHLDGEQVVNAIQKSTNDKPVILELEWVMPVQWPVDVNFFCDSGEARGNEFLHGFAQYGLMLKGHMYFRPFYVIFYLPSDTQEYCMPLEEGKWKTTNGSQLTGTDFCAMPPMISQLSHEGGMDTTATSRSSSTASVAVVPHSQSVSQPTGEESTTAVIASAGGLSSEIEGGLKGRDVLAEDLRQLCLWKVSALQDFDVPNGWQIPNFWEYHAMFWKDDPSVGCRYDFPGMDTGQAIKHCSMRIIRQLLSADQVSKFHSCLVSDVGINLLLQSRETRAWSTLAVQINGARLSGRADPENVVRAVCAALRHKDGYRLSDCAEILTEIALEEPWATSVGISWSSIFVVILMMFIIVGLVLYLYHRRIQEQMQGNLRDEVVLEVRSQMKRYYNLSEDEELQQYDRNTRSPLI
eukprot:GHVQ01042723.1.p1 GENE.GHVQ01042723.1~~GHVQ01042723.1.p1  ORF type:complete len:842 (-),score=122.23 GHVQ01042723.1:1004-3529(-)